MSALPRLAALPTARTYTTAGRGLQCTSADAAGFPIAPLLFTADEVAAGHIDLCFEPALQPYDIVALIPIVEQAGGVVTRLDGSRAEQGGAVLMSATSRLHEEALRLLNVS